MQTLAGITISVAVENTLVGVAVAHRCQPAPAGGGLDAALEEAAAAAHSAADVEHTTGAVRDLLRHGKYKPTGRGKPASEYLRNAAREGRFPRISPLVDINNLISLRWMLPISLIDLDRAASAGFVVRRGRPGEAFVFNPAGQRIELEDLLLVARLPDDLPCATPVKDSMDTKLTDASRNVMAVIYAPASLREALNGATAEFGEALTRWAGAETVVTGLLAESLKLR